LAMEASKEGRSAEHEATVMESSLEEATEMEAAAIAQNVVAEAASDGVLSPLLGNLGVAEKKVGLSQLYWSAFAGAQVIPQCERIRMILNASGIEFEDVDLAEVDNKKERRADMLARSGSDDLPQLFICGKFIGAGSDTLDELMGLNDSGELVELSLESISSLNKGAAEVAEIARVLTSEATEEASTDLVHIDEEIVGAVDSVEGNHEAGGEELEEQGVAANAEGVEHGDSAGLRGEEIVGIEKAGSEGAEKTGVTAAAVEVEADITHETGSEEDAIQASQAAGSEDTEVVIVPEPVMVQDEVKELESRAAANSAEGVVAPNNTHGQVSSTEVQGDAAALNVAGPDTNAPSEEAEDAEKIIVPQSVAVRSHIAALEERASAQQAANDQLRSKSPARSTSRGKERIGD